MKKYLIFLLLFLTIIISGCSNKRNYENQIINNANTVDPIEGELLIEDSSSEEDLNTTSAENIYIDDNKQISINFIDGYKKYNDSQIGFGSLVNSGSLSPIPDSSQGYQFQLNIKDYKSAGDVISEYQDRAMVIKPSAIKVGEFEAVKYAQGGVCEERIIEVIGKKYNYQFSSIGCYDSQQNDFDYLYRTIGQMKIISASSGQAANNLKENQAYYISEKLGIKFIYAVVDPLYGTQKCFISEIGNKITNSCGHSLLILNKDSNTSPAEIINNLIQDKREDCEIVLLDGFNNFDIGFKIMYKDASLDNPGACGEYSSHPMGVQHDIYFSFENQDRYLITNYGGHDPNGVLEVYPDNSFKFWYKTVEIL